MEKRELLTQMERAWQEAEAHSKYIEQVMQEYESQKRPSKELSAKLSELTQQYDEAMHRYKDATRGYYDLTVNGSTSAP